MNKRKNGKTITDIDSFFDRMATSDTVASASLKKTCKRVSLRRRRSSGTKPRAAFQLIEARSLISTAIALGAPAYKAGDFSACATIYRSTAVEISSLSLLPSQLLIKLRREIDSNPTDDKEAALAFRRQFDRLVKYEDPVAPENGEETATINDDVANTGVPPLDAMKELDDESESTTAELTFIEVTETMDASINLSPTFDTDATLMEALTEHEEEHEITTLEATQDKDPENIAESITSCSSLEREHERLLALVEEAASKLAIARGKEAASKLAQREETASRLTFKELTEGYERTYYVNEHGYECNIGEEKTEWVEMNRPRPCSYNSYEWDGLKQKFKPITLGGSSSANNTAIPPAEFRGITARQLRAVIANIMRRCAVENWTGYDGKVLTPETVTLYDVHKFIIQQFTEVKKQSFVTCLPSTAGPQHPRFVLTHWWGTPMTDLMMCIEQFLRDFSKNNNDKEDRIGGGMTSDTPIWIWAFSNNYWNPSNLILTPPDSGVTKAMDVAEGRLIVVLDREGTAFTRIWFVYELFLSEHSDRGLWAIYTAERHYFNKPRGEEERREERHAVGIISGGTPSDDGKNDRITAREQHFPIELITKSLNISIAKGKASEEEDYRRILNSVLGNSGSVRIPPRSHKKFDALNDALKGNFASSQVVLRAALKRGDAEWQMMLTALSKGTTTGIMGFNFKSGGEWSGLTPIEATQLVAHLPLTIDVLGILNAEFGGEFMAVLIRRIQKCTNLKYLLIRDTFVGGNTEGETVGLLLAEAIAANNTIETLELRGTDLVSSGNVAKWADALIHNKTLSIMRLYGVNDRIKKELQAKVRRRIPKLFI